jgi:hypothetical protein
MHKILFILSFCLSLNAWSFNRTQLSRTLLNVFGGQCKSVGSYTQAALNQSQALIRTLEELIDDNECGEAHEIISSLSAFSQNMQASSVSGPQYEVMLLEREIQELTLALNDTTDPIMQSQIATQLSINRLQLISANAELGVNDQVSHLDRQQVGYYYAQDSLRNLMNRIPRLQNCSKKFRQYATQIAGGILSTASFFVNPALGALMSGASGVMNVGLNAVYNTVSNFQLRQLDDINLPTALSCSAEVLTNMYCETLRAESVITTYANLEEDQVTSWDGMPFIFRRLPPLVDWLELVRAGSTASDPFDAQRRLEIMNNNTFLDELKQRLDGFISETDREMKTLTIDLNNYILTKIEFLIVQLQQSKAIDTLNGRDFLPFRLIGFADIPRCNFQGQFQPCPNLQTFRTFYQNGNTVGYRFSLRDWNNAKDNIRIIYREAQDFVNQQLSRILNEDTESVVAQAFEGYEGKLSSFNIFKELITYSQQVKEYLLRYNEGNQYNAHILNIENTQVMVMNVEDLLTKWRDEARNNQGVTPEQSNEKASKLLSEIYAIFNLRTGQRFLMDRIKNIVRWDIIARMKNNDFDAQLIELIRLSNTNIISDITSYRLFDMQDIVNDINNSKGILRASMQVYFRKLNRYFKRSLDLIEKKNLSPEVKNKLCIHLLASDRLAKGIKSKKIMKACRGSSMRSIFKRGQIEIKFDDHVDKNGTFLTDFNHRSCLYNNFMRQARIREQFKD